MERATNIACLKSVVGGGLKICTN